MYPLFATPKRTFLYMLAWLPVGLALGTAMYLVHPRPVSALLLFLGPLLMIYASATTSTWWLLRGERPENLLSGHLVAKMVLAALTTAWLWLLAGQAYYGFLDPHLPASVDAAVRRKDVMLLFLAGVATYWLSAAIHLAFLVSLRAREAERRALESQIATREAELRALRSQLNPHFLFNSLNSIMSLVGRSPEEARRMCQGLGDFLRRTLNLGARDRVSLAEELELVTHYLDIESVRFGPRLSVVMEVPDDCVGCLVPPLLLQPLVENAVKHGVAARLEGGEIRLAVRREGERLHLAITNPRDPDAPGTEGEGVGLENVRRRLKAFAAGQTHLEVRSRPESFAVHLVLPLEGPPPAADPR